MKSRVSQCLEGVVLMRSLLRSAGDEVLGLPVPGGPGADDKFVEIGF